MRRLALSAAFVACVVWNAGAHEVRPAYLELRETAPGAYSVLWKVPARGDLRLSLHVSFPEVCEVTSPQTRYALDGAYVDRWSVACPGGLDGQTITIAGLTSTMTDVLVRIERASGATQVVCVAPSSPSFAVEPEPGFGQIVGTYLRLGVEHILLGIDHLLFVLALLLITVGTRRLVKTITAFTLAHSITLALATLGFVNVPPRPVEAVIALSIVFVAVEIVHVRQGRIGLAAKAPWIVAFVFGLLHGFGFAGALSDIGLPARHIPMALFCFNVGVEVGQLAFVAAVLVLRTLARRVKVPVPRWAEAVPPYAIGAAAMFWVIQRVAAF